MQRRLNSTFSCTVHFSHTNIFIKSSGTLVRIGREKETIELIRISQYDGFQDGCIVSYVQSHFERTNVIFNENIALLRNGK